MPPLLEDLRGRIGETVFLGVMGCSNGVVVAAAEADKPFKISSPPGTRGIPLRAGIKSVAVSLDTRSALPIVVWADKFSAGLDASKTNDIIAETRRAAKRLLAVVDQDL